MNKEEFMAFSLPYRLKLKGLDGSIAILTNGYGISLGEYSLEWVLRTTLSSPILHPLSDLTKEIEHNGDIFTPCDWIINKYPTLYLHLQVQRLIEDINWLNQCDFMFIKHLLEWHFDIAGLIEKGEAIDVNTLKENPYK